jgi:hypothetical protein
MYIVLTGKLSGGFLAWGPFKTADEAQEWAQRYRDYQDGCCNPVLAEPIQLDEPLSSDDMGQDMDECGGT